MTNVVEAMLHPAFLAFPPGVRVYNRDTPPAGLAEETAKTPSSQEGGTEVLGIFSAPLGDPYFTPLRQRPRRSPLCTG